MSEGFKKIFFKKQKFLQSSKSTVPNAIAADLW